MRLNAEDSCQLLTKAHCVLLVGGTLHPFDDLQRSLAPIVPLQRVKTVTCPHVVPNENILAMVAGSLETVLSVFLSTSPFFNDHL